MYPRRVAHHDPSLSARIESRLALLYATGGDESLDRPPHVRSGSGLAWVGRRLAIIQDDANFIALHDPAGGTTLPLTLPAGHDGKRLFDDVRGTKAWKLDLEAAVTVTVQGRPLLLAFGSGSTERRDQIILVDQWSGGAPRVRLVPAPALYGALHAETGFSGSRLNIEGAVQDGGTLRLFSRGNGASRDGREPVNASVDLDLAALLDHLDRGGPVPSLRGPVQYGLGGLGSVPLGVTDVSARDGGFLYAASAETSADATEDGPVAGSVLGVLAEAGLRWTPVCEADGQPCTAKIEGIAPDLADPDLVWAVTDADSPDTPAELLGLRLGGNWMAG